MIKYKEIKRILPRLEKAWTAVSSVPNYQGKNEKLNNIVKSINQIDNRVSSGLNILDIGCNNGVVCSALSCHFDNVIGIDMVKDFYDKAVKTKTIFTKEGYNLSNVKIKNITFKNYVESGQFDADDITAICVSRVLYHMENDEIDLLKTLMDRLKTVIVGVNIKHKKPTNSQDLISLKGIRGFFTSYELIEKQTFFTDSILPVIIFARK